MLSAIVDNVPLVAGSMGMYEITSVGNFVKDGVFWQFLAFCAGTGGSALIIGSAAGVANNGFRKNRFCVVSEKDFYLSFTWVFGGAGTYILMQSL